MYYFGYGANRDSAMIEAITGKSLHGRPAYIEGWELCVQNLSNIPEIPREILQDAWGDHFESYVIREGTGLVNGTLWELHPEDRVRVAKWELIPYGWYKNRGVRAFPEDEPRGLQSVTEVIENQSIDRIVDGMNYKTFLMDREEILAHAERVRGR